MLSKLLGVEFASRLGRGPQVDGNKDERRQQRRVEQLALGRREDTQAHIYDTLGGVMWADQGLEERMRWQRVFFQRREMVMAIMLQARRDHKNGQEQQRPQRGSTHSENVPCRVH